MPLSSTGKRTTRRAVTTPTLGELLDTRYRYNAVTLPLHYCYIAVSLPLHYRYIVVKLPLLLFIAK